jgi:peptidoglycan/xylan/chitin deacetylase (PgdA/CDA1 family)
MTAAQIKALKASGNQISSHSVSHPDLTTLTATQLTNQLKNSQSTLINKFGGPVADFASPYGAYNATTISAIQKYYRSHRSTDTGFNTKDNWNIYDLRVQNIYNTTSPAEVQGWVNEAATQHVWLILVYHEVAATPADPSDVAYTTTPADLEAEIQTIKSSSLGIVTIDQAISEILPQLSR